MRTFDEDLKRNLQDPENLAYFLEAQIESAKELLRVGIIKNMTVGSGSNKTKKIKFNAP